MITNFFEFLGSLLDQYVLRRKIPAFFATRYFDFFSRITNFLLFNDVIFVLFLVYLVFSVHVNISDLHSYFLGKITFVELNIYAKIFLCIFVSFLDIVILLTVLAHSQVVRSYMISKYNSNIMKQLHFNSGTTTLTKTAVTAGVVAVVTVVAEATDAYKCKILVEAWKEVSAQCIEKGQPVPNPPQCGK